MKDIFELLRKTLNTIKYNGLFIFLSIIFPLILVYFDAGKEIFLSLSEQPGQLNLSLCLIAFFVLGYAVWCIPTLAISLFQFMTGYIGDNMNAISKEETKGRKAISKEHLFRLQASIYNDEASVSNSNFNDVGLPVSKQPDKAQFPIRYFAILPWVMFMLTYYMVVYTQAIWIVIGIIFLILLFIAGNLLFKKFRKKIQFPKKGLPFLITCTIPFVIFLLLPYLANLTLLKRVSYVTFPLTGSLGVVVFYYTLRLLEEKKVNYKLANFNYCSFLVVLTLTITAFYVLNNFQLLSEVSLVVVLLIISALLITVIDLFFTSQYVLIKLVKSKLVADEHSVVLFKIRLYQVAIITLPFVLVALTLFSSLNTHRIRKTHDSGNYVSITQRTTLTGYFDDWYHKNRDAIKDTIYLISGQGGGSRAAAWFFMNMAEKEKLDPEFFKKVFSISTVSGSSVGAHMYIGAKYYNKPVDFIDTTVSKVLFARNYLSSNFFGLLLGDGIDGVIDKIFGSDKGFPKDRNYYFQKEEMKAFEKAFDIDTAHFFEQDYFHIYQDTSRKFPLFFINTAIVDKGTRGVFSPVKLEGVSLARDLYKEFKNEDCNGGFNIPITTCVNQSEAFPLVSAYNFMDNVGRFIDGGLYENTGCATTLEIYQILRAHLNSSQDSTVKQLKIVLYNFINSSVSDDHTVAYKNASILNSLTAITNTPFGGHQNFAFHNLSRQVSYINQLEKSAGKDTVFNIPLNESVTLTRCLSDSTIRSMYKALSKTH